MIMASVAVSPAIQDSASSTDSIKGDTNEQFLVSETKAFISTSTIYSTSTKSTQKAVEAYLRNEFIDEPILVDIARCESSFRQFDSEGHVIRGKVNSGDVGVMQINEKYHAEDAVKLGLNIYTIEGNTAFAKHLYHKYGAQPWSASSKCWSRNTSADIALK